MPMMRGFLQPGGQTFSQLMLTMRTYCWGRRRRAALKRGPTLARNIPADADDAHFLGAGSQVFSQLMLMMLGFFRLGDKRSPS